MSTPDREVWDSVRAHLREQHHDVWRHWFTELEPLGVAGGSFALRAHSEYHRDYLRTDCLDAFLDAVRTATGQLIGVRFLGPDDAWETPKATRRGAEAKRAARTPAATLDGAARSAVAPVVPARKNPASERVAVGRPDSLSIDPDNDFENFVVGPNNRLSWAASVAVSQNPGISYNPLFIHGDVGLGKTHLLHSICLDIRKINPDTAIHYVSCDAFVTHFMDAVQSGEMSGFRHEFRDVDVLVIDDIHFLTGRERTQEEFFHTFNSLFQANKQIILSSDAAPEEIPDLEDRLVSRFKWGLVAKIEPPSYETRVLILKKKAALRGIELPNDCAEHVARCVTTNIRELEGAILKLSAHAAVDKRPVDITLTREIIGEPKNELSSGPTIDGIIQTVTDFYHVKRTEVLGKRRHKSVSLPRQVCMYFARTRTRHSLEEIGAHFGGRDHTTVMHAVRTIDTRRNDDEEFAKVLVSLEDRLH